MTLIAASGLALGGVAALATGWSASASPENPHKVWVCKYVQKPDSDEALKGGKQPIFVDWASLDGNGTEPHVGDMFKDGQTLSVVVQIGGDSPGAGACKDLEPPKTPPTTMPPSTTGQRHHLHLPHHQRLARDQLHPRLPHPHHQPTPLRLHRPRTPPARHLRRHLQPHHRHLRRLPRMTH